MPGPAPKPAGQRRRRNVTPGARTLYALDGGVETPALPEWRDWLAPTVEWWNDVWSSPMAPEYDESDVHGLYILAALVDGFWAEPSKELAAEIRLQRQSFGLSPIDRRRLAWEIDRGEQAEESSARRRAPVQQQGQSAPVAQRAVDPRLVDFSARRSARSSATGSKRSSSTGPATSKARRSSSTTSSGRSSGGRTKSSPAAPPAPADGSTDEPS